MASSGAQSLVGSQPPRTVSDLLSYAKREGLHLFLEEGQLRYRSARPPSEPLLSVLRERKEGLISALSGGLNRIPMSTPQRQLWSLGFLREGGLGTRPYTEGLRLVVPRRCSSEASTWALEQLVKEHDAIRAEFDWDGTTQTILPPTGPAVRVTHHASEQLARAASLDAAQETMSKSWELSVAPQIFLRVDTCDCMSILTLFGHHICIDGWSLLRLMEELWEYLTSYETGSDLPKRTGLSIKRYIEARQSLRASAGADFARQQSSHFWENLQGQRICSLSTTVPTRRSYRGGRLECTLEGTWMRLTTVAEEFGVMPIAVVGALVASACLAARDGEHDGVLFAISMDGRGIADCVGTVGYCSEVHPVWVPAEERSYSTLARDLHRGLLRAFALQTWSWADQAQDTRCKILAPTAGLTVLDASEVQFSHVASSRLSLVAPAYRDMGLSFTVLRLPGGDIDIACDYSEDSNTLEDAKEVLDDLVARLNAL